ncbi:MAG: proton-conducting transporter membrane subunit [Spirochaetes bacterium]|nr:proton-conducting transporter membrane subunit [Spirochaetota bacterium]
MPVNLNAIAIVLMATSGIPGLFMPRASAWGQRIATCMVCLGVLAGLTGVGIGFIHPDCTIYILPWQASRGALVGIDALSAFFMVPILVMGGLGSIYGLSYWPQKRKARTAPKLQFFWGTLMAGMSLLVIGKNAMAFLLGWEIMALSAFFLISTEDDRKECRESGLVYMIATHLGTLTLFGLFVLWRYATGSFDLVPMPAAGSSVLVVNLLFFLALVGFGLKAGIMPLHFWLPGAHAAAPSHVSAILSGVMLKMGIYGLVRMLSLLPDPPALWGGLILFLGATSGLLGVVFALAQHDLKRLLAYHSVENIGIILMGLGLAMLGRSYDRPEWILLGMAGCLLHVWNHGLFKSLLFLGAGSIMHGAHTRQIDELGGLARRMPWTATLFLVGAVAICGLPPLNGFISEFLVYVGLFRTFLQPMHAASLAIVAVPALAMIGALAVACFVKVYGTVFLGLPRTQAASRAHESQATMVIPMLVLAISCLTIGFAPGLVAPVLEQAVAAWQFHPASTVDGLALTTLVPLGALGSMVLVLLAASILPALYVWSRRTVRKDVGTWDCGYARPGPRMQYTSSSFAQSLVCLFKSILKPRTHEPDIQGYSPPPSAMASHVDEVVLDRALIPGFQSFRKRLGWFNRFQQGQIQNYIFYILAALLALLATLVPFRALLASLLVS